MNERGETGGGIEKDKHKKMEQERGRMRDTRNDETAKERGKKRVEKTSVTCGQSYKVLYDHNL